MMGNATWGGLLLDDLLRDAGIDIFGTTKKHIVFEGYDFGPDGKPYAVSFPISLFCEMRDDIMIAHSVRRI
jgi:hypothetical protein